MSNELERFTKYVQLVRDGFTPLEPAARILAEQNGLDAESLETAMSFACSRLMKLYIREIREGRIRFADRAYELAHMRNYPAAEIDKALAEGTKRSH